MTDPITDDRPEREPQASTDAAPRLLRLAAGAWLRTAEWTLGNSLRAGGRLVRAATSGQAAAELVEEIGSEVRGGARRLLGLTDIEDLVRRVVPDDVMRDGGADGEVPDADSLRGRGAELMRKSADVHYEEHDHPAYERILGELAPDEGRILRMLALQGPQPAVDIRTWRPLDIASELIAPGLTMIGAEAGCRYLDRVPAYLNNLYRLGLIWFSREPLLDPLRYQVLEAQPDVLAGMRRAGRGRTVRRSIHLTPFGRDFCETCLPLETGELDALPITEQPAEPAGADPDGVPDPAAGAAEPSAPPDPGAPSAAR